MAELKRTCLYDFHVDQGAKMVPFAGYEMPVPCWLIEGLDELDLG